ncbi:gibberellin 2-beta-dioxygenase 2-like [Diospyros lotus]|uniref:gibberellin 2-beta-dioxygenase 2-like n=1 Tax=Diospyros lotus TaxID=55363 RepID=UPI0022590286|nr:gibberellin 2-beta-dioxygenase 2-like [Diospyros lotus]
MVVAPPTSPLILRTNTKKTRAVGNIPPTVDLSLERSLLSQKIVEACEEFGFFKVVNHGFPRHIIASMEREAADFFARPASLKQQAAARPPTPFGYGCRNIGFNGDMGELEYLLLHANPHSVSQGSHAISANPTKFSCAVNEYIEAVRQLGSEILDLVGEGLLLEDKWALSRLITDVHSDSCFRLNHYPPPPPPPAPPPRTNIITATPPERTGFGEHSDPQILTLLRSNDVGGLQICLDDGLWVPVPSDPTQFCVFVGDALQAMTNGRFVSARHRVVVGKGKGKGRQSMLYFGAPPLNAWISALPEMHSHRHTPIIQYKPFTWAQFKKAAYSLRLGDPRLHLFKATPPPPPPHPNN